MAVTADAARGLALSLEGVSAVPHFDRTAFRTPRRIFATLAADGAELNLMFDPELQAFYCAQAPDAFAPVPGGWGKSGATCVLLAAADPDTFRGALMAAHARACLPPPAKARKGK
jgi:hypothetical protein